MINAIIEPFECKNKEQSFTKYESNTESVFTRLSDVRQFPTCYRAKEVIKTPIATTIIKRKSARAINETQEIPVFVRLADSKQFPSCYKAKDAASTKSLLFTCKPNPKLSIDKENSIFEKLANVSEFPICYKAKKTSKFLKLKNTFSKEKMTTSAITA